MRIIFSAWNLDVYKRQLLSLFNISCRIESFSKVSSFTPFLPFRLLHSVILSSVVVLSGIVRLSSTLFFMLYYFFIL